MTKHDSEQKLRLVADVQQEIINIQRLYIEELEKKLPEDNRTRWKHFLEHAKERLKVIHSRKKDDSFVASGF